MQLTASKNLRLQTSQGPEADAFLHAMRKRI